MSRYQRYPAYRDSGVEWIGEIPGHWEVKQTRHIFKIFSGSTPKSGEELYWDGDITWFTPDDLGNNQQKNISESRRKITEEGYKSCGTSLAKKNSIVFSTRAPIGHIALSTVPACCNQGCRILEPENGNTDYWYYTLVSAKPVLQSLGQGSTFMELPRQSLASFNLPCPSLEEQQAIACFLERKTAEIDELITKKEELLKKLDEKRSALITRAVTKGLAPSAPMKESGVEWLGKIPNHWDIAALHHITILKSGESIIATMMDENEEFPVYGGNGFRGYFSNYTHNGDYILIGRQGALCGNINYASGKFWASEHAIVLTPTQTIISTWLGELLKAMNLNQYSVSAAQPGLSAEVIGRLKIPLPPLDEQQAIAEHIEKKTATIDRQKAQVTEAIERLKEYRSALITDTVTGKMDVHSIGKKESLST